MLLVYSFHILESHRQTGRLYTVQLRQMGMKKKKVEESSTKPQGRQL